MGNCHFLKIHNCIFFLNLVVDYYTALMCKYDALNFRNHAGALFVQTPLQENVFINIVDNNSFKHALYRSYYYYSDLNEYTYRILATVCCVVCCVYIFLIMSVKCLQPVSFHFLELFRKIIFHFSELTRYVQTQII